MAKTKVIAIIGKSGSGKNTILRQFTDQYPLEQINIIVPFTTRPKRPGEQDEIDYHFLTTEHAAKLILDGEVAQVVDFRGWLYGTLWDDLKEDKINIGIFNPKAVDYLNDYVDLDITTVYIIASDKERLLRQLLREEDPDVREIIRRYGTDDRDFSDLELYLPKVIRINNPTIETPNDNWDALEIFEYRDKIQIPINQFIDIVERVAKSN